MSASLGRRSVFASNFGRASACRLRASSPPLRRSLTSRAMRHRRQCASARARRPWRRAGPASRSPPYGRAPRARRASSAAGSRYAAQLGCRRDAVRDRCRSPLVSESKVAQCTTGWWRSCPTSAGRRAHPARQRRQAGSLSGGAHSDAGVGRRHCSAAGPVQHHRVDVGWGAGRAVTQPGAGRGRGGSWGGLFSCGDHRAWRQRSATPPAGGCVNTHEGLSSATCGASQSVQRLRSH